MITQNLSAHGSLIGLPRDRSFLVLTSGSNLMADQTGIRHTTYSMNSALLVRLDAQTSTGWDPTRALCLDPASQESIWERTTSLIKNEQFDCDTQVRLLHQGYLRRLSTAASLYHFPH
jgi:hypothetical protein